MTPEYRRTHYLENKGIYLKNGKLYKKLLESLITHIKDKPCADCGGKFPACAMDFDHVSGEKVMNIARLSRLSSPASLLSEIKKCELVCANCHRIRTFFRPNPPSYLSIEEICEIFASRRKTYDREIWEELFQMAGAVLPAPPEKRKRAPRFVRKIGPEGTSWCSSHQDFLPVSRFEKNISRWNGLQGQCIDCRKKSPSRRPKKSQAVSVFGSQHNQI